VHGDSAHLVPAGDPDAVASAIVELASEPSYRARLARGARQVFEQHFSCAAGVRVIKDALVELEGDPLATRPR